MAIVKRNKDNVSGKLVINQLNIKTLNRQRQDIESWRTALRSADNNRYTRLFDLYKDILLDNVLDDAIDKRIEKITNAELTFQVNGKEVDEITELIDTPEWESMLESIMQAKFWGFTVLEFGFSPFNAYSIPRNHINPKLGIITKNENDEHGWNYRNDRFFLEIKGRKKYGEILKACPYVLYKRGNIGDWAQYAEIFGIPMRIGKYNTFNPEDQENLQKALDESGSALSMTIPKDTDIEIKENNSKGDGELFEKLRKACNEEILIGMLGQTMTTLSGSSKSQSETHRESEDSKNRSDRRFVQRVLNREVLPRLEERGFPVNGGKFNFKEDDKLSLKERLEVDKSVAEVVEVDEDYWYEKYGVPKPKNGKTKKPGKQEKKPVNSKPNKEKQELNEDGFWQKLFTLFSFQPRGTGASFDWNNPHE